MIKMDKVIEQRIYFKFCIKNEISYADAYVNNNVAN